MNEYNSSDWDILVLHYLGLDHIGHSFGSKSPLIIEKLLEMDSIIGELYSHLLKVSEMSLLNASVFVISGSRCRRPRAKSLITVKGRE